MDDVDVPAEFWWARGEAALEQNWSTGDFETWLDRQIYCRAYGVTFREADIAAMLRGAVRPELTKAHGLSGTFADASRCVAEIVETTKRGASAIQQEILRHCRARLIGARCATFHDEVTDRYGKEIVEEENIVIPQWFWDHCVDHEDVVLGTVDGHQHRVRMTGVQFEVARIVDLESLLVDATGGAITTTPEAPQTDSAESTECVAKRGRKATYDWEAAVTKIWGAIYRGELIPDNQADIEKAFQRLLSRGDKEPSESTVRPFASRIWNELQTEA
jgi:hypothetical protein